MIENWLNALESSDFKTDEITTKVTAKGQIHPTTPPRRATVACDEASPTDTCFSGPSVFDPGLHKKPKNNQRDDFSDTTITDNHGPDAESRSYGEFEQAIGPLPPNLDITHISPDDKLAINTTITGPIHNASEPRLVWITSCLQCTLENLPCSRTHPSCTRCQRNGHAATCLLYRRCFAFEAGDPNGPSGPVLLKVKGEDEDMWKRKLDLARELWAGWCLRQERRN